MDRSLDLEPPATGHSHTGASRSLYCKFRSAFCGLQCGLRSEGNFRIHAFMALAVVVAGVAFGVSRVEWCLLALCIAAVMAAEMFNTALELLARAISSQYHADIEAALDISSAGVLLASFGAAAAGSLIFIHRLGATLGYWPATMG